jgi:hypothetical protein
MVLKMRRARFFADFTLRGRARSLAALKMTVPKAPGTAVAPATAFPTGSGAAASRSQSKALRAFSYKVVRPKAHEICAQDDSAGPFFMSLQVLRSENKLTYAAHVKSL